jgi:hypothetical protein
MKGSAQQTENQTVVISASDWDSFGRLLETIRSQSEMIARLTTERNERLHRDTLAAQRRAEVFRIPARS